MNDILSADSRIKSLAQQYFPNNEDREDAVQEAYIKLLSVGVPPALDNQIGWITRVVTNLFRDIYSRNKKVRELDQYASVDEAIDTNCPLSYTERVAEEENLWRRIDDLPADLYVVAHMYYLAGLSYTEIASELSIPEGTVASRLNTIRKFLVGGD